MSGTRNRRDASAYSDVGVDYVALDAGKRDALTAALTTSPLLAVRGGAAVDASRGEPAFVFEFNGQHLAFVLEGLGTKSIIARDVAEQTNANHFAAVAHDTVAAIVNDLCCVGALPLVVNAYFATGSSDWYRHGDWHSSLIAGWQAACEEAGATWGGGESPSLPELLLPNEIELAGSAIGAVPNGHTAILGEDLAPGDEIVLIASSGLHANGSSLARLVASRPGSDYSTPLPSGRTFGEALLDRSVIYARLIEAILNANVPVSYCSHITGHGLLKLMRPDRQLTYRISHLPPVPEVLEFLKHQADMSEEAAYRTFNMGCGFAIYTASGAGREVAEIATKLGYSAIVAGRVEKGPRRVVIEPVGVTFASDEMDLTPRQAA
jgi:phosphoribosylformylglycinamidine cyclo-ligase